jgi:hypothetical protein
MGAGHLVQDAAGVFEQELARIGGDRSTPVACQQGLAQLDLQAADVAAQGGLGQAQHLGAPGKAGLLGHGHKRFELLEVHAVNFDITNYLIFKK